MPELPEVETTARGMSPHLVGQRIESFDLREARLRWPVDGELVDSLVGVTVRSVTRRSKIDAHPFRQRSNLDFASGHEWLLANL